jgi:ribosomal protein S7
MSSSLPPRYAFHFFCETCVLRMLGFAIRADDSLVSSLLRCPKLIFDPQNSTTSYAVKKKDELERVAKGNR